MALKQLAAEYFGNLNSIASRINADLQVTKKAYEEHWNELSMDEQDRILTESIIKPEVSVLYSQLETGTNEEFAMKVVLDDHCSYRDEHSGPFSFRTKSQRNLTVFSHNLPVGSTETHRETKTKFVPKPKVPLYAPGLDLVEREKNDGDFSSNASSLPKTGLDFLDNW